MPKKRSHIFYLLRKNRYKSFILYFKLAFFLSLFIGQGLASDRLSLGQV